MNILKNDNNTQIYETLPDYQMLERGYCRIIL